jgi:hypothetical protein
MSGAQEQQAGAGTICHMAFDIFHLNLGLCADTEAFKWQFECNGK